MIRQPSIHKIAEKAAAEFKVTVEQITAPWVRLPEVKKAKAAVAYIAFKEFGYSYERIGKSLERDETTILCNAETARDLLREDAGFRRSVDGLVKALRPAPAAKPAAASPTPIASIYGPQIKKLRDKNWSLDSICRHLNLPKHEVAPLIGVTLVGERRA